MNEALRIGWIGTGRMGFAVYDRLLDLAADLG